nr:MAG TPA: hypothetical protein [Caudoviricetes sp.]
MRYRERAQVLTYRYVPSLPPVRLPSVWHLTPRK